MKILPTGSGIRNETPWGKSREFSHFFSFFLQLILNIFLGDRTSRTQLAYIRQEIRSLMFPTYHFHFRFETEKKNFVLNKNSRLRHHMKNAEFCIGVSYSAAPSFVYLRGAWRMTWQTTETDSSCFCVPFSRLGREYNSAYTIVFSNNSDNSWVERIGYNIPLFIYLQCTTTSRSYKAAIYCNVETTSVKFQISMRPSDRLRIRTKRMSRKTLTQ